MEQGTNKAGGKKKKTADENQRNKGDVYSEEPQFRTDDLSHRLFCRRCYDAMMISFPIHTFVPFYK